jgi:hypothetical protein
MKKHKPIKPRNYVQIALAKRGGSGQHKKSNKQLRKALNQQAVIGPYKSK